MTRWSPQPPARYAARQRTACSSSAPFRTPRRRPATGDCGRRNRSPPGTAFGTRRSPVTSRPNQSCRPSSCRASSSSRARTAWLSTCGPQAPTGPAGRCWCGSTAERSSPAAGRARSTTVPPWPAEETWSSSPSTTDSACSASSPTPTCAIRRRAQPGTGDCWTRSPHCGGCRTTSPTSAAIPERSPSSASRPVR